MISDHQAMWIAVQLANGNAFFFGSALIVAVAVWSMFRQRLNALSRVAYLLGIGFVSVSSTPLPHFLYAIWAVGVIGFACANSFSDGRFRRVTALSLILLTLIATAMEVPHLSEPGIVIDPGDTIYVIGDSITAGVDDRKREMTWPALLRNGRGLQVVDLSQAGATLSSALNGQQPSIPSGQPAHSAVILEIGGNDLLGEVGAARFRSDLNKLLMAIRPKAHSIVMLELPLFPFHNDHGTAQRSLAKEYHVSLIPKRNFADLIGTRAATLDGLHLSASGQMLMAELASKVIGSRTETSAERSPASATDAQPK